MSGSVGLGGCSDGCRGGGVGVVLSRDQVRRVDRLALDEYHMIGLVLMENAGRHASEYIVSAYGHTGRAIVFCGPGNNGGDGFVIARHLHNAGWLVRLVLAGDPTRLTPDAQANRAITRAMGLHITEAPDEPTQRAAANDIEPDDVVIDALLGTGFAGAVRSPTAELIHAMNDAPKRAMVAIDVPSGFDCDSGEPSNATIKADLTVTFVADKLGFKSAGAARFVGKVVVGDIGVPRELIAKVAAEP